MIWLRPLGRRTTTDCEMGKMISGERSSQGLEFFHSLFAWLSLLTAFKYWLDKEPDKDVKILVNNKMYALRDIAVVGKGKRLAIIANGKRMTRGQVNIMGVVYEVEGKLIIDTTGDYYSNIPDGIGGITVEVEDDTDPVSVEG